MRKQMVPTCVCGQLMYFPVGKSKFQCPKCPTMWDRNSAGYWAESGSRLMFTPIFTEPEKPKLARFHSFAKWEKKNRKAGRKCLKRS